MSPHLGLRQKIRANKFYPPRVAQNKVLLRTGLLKKYGHACDQYQFIFIDA